MWQLEIENKNQLEIDSLWGEIKGLFLGEMSKLPDLPTSKNKKNRKNFNKSQPFWNDELSYIWKEVCRTERADLQCKVTENGQLRQKQYLRSIKIVKNYLIKNFDILKGNTIKIGFLNCLN